MLLTDWREAGKRFDYNGLSIFYRDEGEGEALVCIHGFPTASWDWHALWPDLTGRFRVIALDMVGFGFSDKPRHHAYSIHEQATVHQELLRSLGVGRFHILAHDYGDTVAQELLAREAERGTPGQQSGAISSVCLLNGGLFPETHRPLPIQKLLLSPLGPLVARLTSERRFRKTFSAIFGRATRPSDHELSDFWALIAFNDGIRAAPRVIQYMRERSTYRARWVGALQTTAVPRRLIIGAADPVSGAHVAARYRELVPHPDVVILEDIGHYPQLEDPVAVRQAFLAFVDSVRK